MLSGSCVSASKQLQRSAGPKCVAFRFQLTQLGPPRFSLYESAYGGFTSTSSFPGVPSVGVPNSRWFRYVSPAGASTVTVAVSALPLAETTTMDAAPLGPAVTSPVVLTVATLGFSVVQVKVVVVTWSMLSRAVAESWRVAPGARAKLAGLTVTVAGGPAVGSGVPE